VTVRKVSQRVTEKKRPERNNWSYFSNYARPGVSPIEESRSAPVSAGHDHLKACLIDESVSNQPVLRILITSLVTGCTRIVAIIKNAGTLLISASG